MENHKQVLVIGGGIAGLTAAQELARMGLSVLLIERGPFLGGRAANLTCKATDRCVKCNRCLVEEKLKTVSIGNNLAVMVRTHVEALEGNGQGFRGSFRSRPKLIDAERCTDCGLCFKKCPEAGRGAMLMAPSPHLHPFYAIDPMKCTCIQNGDKGICESLCPEGAITLDAKEQWYEVEVDGLLLATGYQPFNPREIKRFNFDHFKNMVTAMDMEEILRHKGDIFRPSDHSHPERIAFIQCVGSRDPHINRAYCSRVCCGYALRMALRILHLHPEIQITLFYMDIQNFGKDFERYYAEARDKIRLVRGLPGDFYGVDRERISVSFYDERTHKTNREDFDMIILSVGMSPSTSQPFFRDIFALSLDQDGFLSVTEAASNRGIVLAGSTEGPMDVSETISHGKKAAFEMARYLGTVGK